MIKSMLICVVLSGNNVTLNGLLSRQNCLTYGWSSWQPIGDECVSVIRPQIYSFQEESEHDIEDECRGSFTGVDQEAE